MPSLQRAGSPKIDDPSHPRTRRRGRSLEWALLRGGRGTRHCTNLDGTVTPTPIEFGAINLQSSDRIEHASKGAFGALIIEPPSAIISEFDTYRRAVATVSGGTEGSFREFVILLQNDVNLRTDSALPDRCFPGDPGPAAAGQGWPVDNLGCVEDPEDSGQKAINYRTEPLWKRMQHAPGTPFSVTDDFTDWWDVLANAKVRAEPQTPVFTVAPAQKVRFRLLMPGGHSRNIVFSLAGHVWDKEPYVQNSTRLGSNPFSFWEGAHMGFGPSNHFDLLLRNGAGGKFSINNDYLFRDHVGSGLDAGLWGILRVQ